jgi:hypothetical protein
MIFSMSEEMQGLWLRGGDWRLLIGLWIGGLRVIGLEKGLLRWMGDDEVQSMRRRLRMELRGDGEGGLDLETGMKAGVLELYIVRRSNSNEARGGCSTSNFRIGSSSPLSIYFFLFWMFQFSDWPTRQLEVRLLSNCRFFRDPALVEFRHLERRDINGRFEKGQKAKHMLLH